MKSCPKCQRQYTDESLNYCLEDGEILVDQVRGSDPATVLLAPDITSGEVKTRTFEEAQTAGGKAAQTASKKKWAITAGLGILLVTLLALGSFWFYGNLPHK